MKSAEEIFKLYEEGVSRLRLQGIYEKTSKNYDFFEGRQWEGLIANGYNPPVENVIKQIVKHKYNTISMQDIEIIFTSSEAGSEEITKLLNGFMEQFWEEKKMYSHMWRMNKASHIAGDSYLYFYDKGIDGNSDIDCQPIDNTNIYFEDEREPDIQKQKYVIISQRFDVEDVRKLAIANGVDELEAAQIVSDEEAETKNKPFYENTKNNKVTGLLYLYMEDEELHYIKCVRNVIYESDNTSLSLYPIAKLICNEKKGSARGIGEVEPLINNQIEINKTLWRRSESIKNTAFPYKVVNESYVSNANDLKKAGAIIKARGNPADIGNIVKYIAPSYIGNDAKEFSDELIMMTKELNNSGDGATGQIDPTKASGAAVQAVTQQANVSSSEQMAAYKQFVEDVGYIILDMVKTYNPNGITVLSDEGSRVISPSDIERVKLKINISQATPFNKWAVESELKSLFQSGQITFEEFVNSLDENAMTPKNKLLKILESRAENAKKEEITKKLIQIISKYQMNDISETNMKDLSVSEGETENV